MEFKTTDLLRSYVQKIDDLALQLERFYIFDTVRFGGALLSTDFPKSQDTIRTGCRVWVRYLNGLDLNVETNILFVEQNETNIYGIDGLKFWELLGTQKKIIGTIGKIGKSSIDLMPYLSKQIAGTGLAGQIISALYSLQAAGIAEHEAYIQKTSIDYLQYLLATFTEFTEKYAAEYLKQFPDATRLPWTKEVPELKGQKPARFTVKDNQNGTITVQGLNVDDIVQIDGGTGEIVKVIPYVSSVLSDGSHKVTAIGMNDFSYAETVNVTTKVSVFSNPLGFVNENKVVVFSLIFLLILIYILWKKGYFVKRLKS